MARKPGGKAMTTEEAADLLGWTVDTFRRVADVEAEWFCPMGIRGERGHPLWSRRLVLALACVYERKRLPPRQSRREESGENLTPDHGGSTGTPRGVHGGSKTRKREDGTDV